MTDLLERAVASLRALPPERQEDVARLLLHWTGEDEAVYLLSPEEKASLAESMAQADRGEFASDAEVAAVWAKHGLGISELPDAPVASW